MRLLELFLKSYPEDKTHHIISGQCLNFKFLGDKKSFAELKKGLPISHQYFPLFKWFPILKIIEIN